ncbi:LuxR family transcriptional regulator [Alloalcanivorax xenomutans]|jgi:LuxR family transcriptional regulator, quorum-sensing system regulator LasR|uniref:LuxR family transcriptional regulator n=1 Tax=Alloalcanivorax xenomutans TaxID=1094342 RepID=A0A9Q3W4R7_9GAMM|nr:LuxR family transcriptional regulator [Alloalcanivorax xenomutans]MCE7508327.1 LuxR family transcriptional regulator [Alloalcanivorax xenomutans]MCE7524433.1 LuxR family transcriptional regulator [Alloalcanivorax xenomutans]
MSQKRHLGKGHDPWEDIRESLRHCDSAESLSELHAAIERFSQRLGFNHFFFMHVLSPHRIQGSTTLIHNYPEAWCQRYHQENYHRMDPIVEHCRHHTVPVLWRNLFVNDNQRFFVDQARTHGLKQGITFPIHATGEWGLLSFNWHCAHHDDDFVDRSALLLGQLFASHALEGLRRIQASKRDTAAEAALTQREKQCLLWAAEGKTAWETGQILDIAPRTVVYHLNNAVAKLDASNRTQAAVKAFPTLSIDVDAIQRATVTVVTS